MVTPLCPVSVTAAGRPRRILLKLEGRSPAGSIKGRTARSLVEALEAEGRLRPGATLIESTSGNLGVGLALVAANRGYAFHAVVDPRAPGATLGRMRRLGATVEMVADADACGGYLAARLARVRERCASSDAFVWTDQYHSDANPRAHETQTGPELLAQAGAVDAVFAAVSTGGTAAGLARFFRAASPATRVVAVDVEGSVALGGAPGPRLLTGIGSARRSCFLPPGLVDEAVVVSDVEAILACRTLRARSGIGVGGSSGAVIAACSRYLVGHPAIERPVCICADGAESYADTIYDDAWLERHGIASAGMVPEPSLRLAAS